MNNFNPKRIIVIGCGGIGSHLLPPLVKYLNASDYTGILQLVDGDKYEDKNLDRQEFPSQLVSQNKAEALKMLYDKKYPDAPMQILAFADYIGEKNVDIISEDSLVLMCVDNHTCRRIVSKRCQELQNAILISAGNSSKLDGNIQIHRRFNGKDMTPPIENRHPEIITEQDGDRTEMSCEVLAQIPGGEQVIFANVFAATLMGVVTYDILNNMAGIEHCEEIYFDGFFAKTKRIVNGRPE